MVREGTRSAALYDASLWIHPNVPGRRDLKEARPYRLQLPEGMAVYPAEGSVYPRLPLLGLRALLRNKLKLVIDGKHNRISLRSPFWTR
jgi:hypothetical protein